MDNEAIVGYVRDNLEAGYSEDTLRSHLADHGWAADAIDQAFLHARPVERPDRTVAEPVRRGGKQKAAGKTKRRLITFGVVVAVVVAGWAVWHIVKPGTPDAASAPVLAQLNQQTRQENDVSIVAGAVGQYTAANNGVLPSVASNVGGNLVLCNSVCDPLTSQVATLSYFDADDVKIMPYIQGLVSPNTKVMYLVPLAKCGTDGKVAGTNSNARSMVLLYDAENEHTTGTPRCVTL